MRVVDVTHSPFARAPATIRRGVGVRREVPHTSLCPASSGGKHWKFGTNGDWCQFFKDDGGKGWPIAGAANASSSVVWSGTVPGNGC